MGKIEEKEEREINKAIWLIKTIHAFYFVALLLHNTVLDKKLQASFLLVFNG